MPLPAATLGSSTERTGDEPRPLGEENARGPLWRRSFQQFARTVDAISGFLAFAAMLCGVVALGVMFVYTTAGVLGRYTGWFAVLSADEIGGYALAALFFLGLPYAFRRNHFVRVGVVYARLNPRHRAAMDAAFCLISLIAALVLTYYFWQFVLQSYRFHLLSIGVVQVHLYLPQLAMGIGMSLFAFELFAAFLRLLATGVPLGGDDELGI
jgi:TRAP-type C4-dicarboxylate transport system permease small subunit